MGKRGNVMIELSSAEDGRKRTLEVLEEEKQQIQRAMDARLPEKTIQTMKDTLRKMQEMSGEE